MTTLNYTVRFQKTVLASLIGLFISQSSFALEELSDAGLSETTGEGIAILPQNTYMVFRGAGANETTNQILTDRTKDTGYINYVPVGPLSMTAADTNKNGSIDSGDRAVGKADIFLYGLALSKSDNDTTTRLASTDAAAAISSWGTAVNPWIFKVATENSVPNFSTTNCSGVTDPSCQVTYLSLEAPLYEVGTRDTAGLDAYKLKLGLWTDIFVRNPNKINGASDQFNYGDSNGLVGTSIDASRANRLRLQGIWNNFSLNGSRLQLFQTLGGATSSGGMSSFYNNTLGAAGVIRLNSGDSQNIKAIVSSAPVTEASTTSAWTLVHAGANSTLSTSTTGDCNNGSTGSFGTSAGCRYYVEKRTRTDSKTASKTWDASSLSNAGVLRLSTRESSDTGNILTPAINGGVAPTFDGNEGLYLYNPNINLVLGTLYQPLILSSDGKNFSIEIARIANKPEIYKQIYTDYSGADTSYKGSTCNVYQCGGQLTLGGKSYQGYNATHSSITIGTAYSEDGGKTLRASTDEGALGISFGKLNSGTVSQTTYSNQMTEVHYKQRGVNTQTWVQSYSCTLFICGAGTTGYLYQWEYNNGSSPWAILAPTTKPADATCSPSIGCSGTSGTTPMYGSIANRNWANSSAVWLTAGNNEVNNLIGSNNGMTGTTFPTLNQAPTPVINASPMNNMGSAVIDGVLIQHLKLTTKGL
ncbi:hypothetical protein [Acinetobacter seifertii]|uniref:hypothetical protein n=2 Tax=Acinetobacter calcoaceticus/baumannii complex TaxID=909768 RepID=UPI000D3B204D|nr:hypothetical protein [Acinetobacter seifertii]PTV53886.1 hypothetical protein DBL04_10095 [Acinetobacter seifertii]